MKKYISALLAVLLLTTNVFAYSAVDASDYYDDVPHDAWYRPELTYALGSDCVPLLVLKVA